MSDEKVVCGFNKWSMFVDENGAVVIETDHYPVNQTITLGDGSKSEFINLAKLFISNTPNAGRFFAPEFLDDHENELLESCVNMIQKNIIKRTAPNSMERSVQLHDLQDYLMNMFRVSEELKNATE